MRTRSEDSRPRDYLPQDLHAEVTAVARHQPFPLSYYWALASADGAAQAQRWLDTGRPGRSPLPPAVAWSDVHHPKDIKWRQRLAVETEEIRLIKAAGSSRTAVLIRAAQAYAASGGNMVALIAEGLAQRQRLTVPTADEVWAMVTGSCPDMCPLAVADTRPCWAQRLLSSGAPKSGQPAQSPDAG